MSHGGPHSERVLVLAPAGRDAALAASILAEADVPATICNDLACLCAELASGAATAMVVEEALHRADLSELAGWIARQPAWSDFPFVLLTPRGGGLERNPAAVRLRSVLGNVAFLERPFHPTTLLSVVESALRGRRRQYQARGMLEAIKRGETQLERRVEDRTAELAAANRQLAEQIAEREKAENALRRAQRLEAVGQLTSGVAHDFNNLLTVILGNVRQLQKTMAEAPVARRLGMIAEAAERGAKLTAQMLAFSRQQKLDTRPVDLNDTVERMRQLLQSTIGGQVGIETRLQPDLWPALIDPTQIELVILNLAINARDAMEVGGQVTVETANVRRGAPARSEEPPPGEYVMVAVGDTGPGMSEAVLAKAFEPFFTTKPVGKGSGLGLSQVYGLAKQSGGGVEIDNRPGEGATVKVYLPRADHAASQAEAVRQADPAEVATPATVLLVDDDDAVREVTAGILQELGYSVLEAGSGGAALEMFDRHPDIEVVLLDYAMPGMNGAEVARHLRNRARDVPILFATGFADAEALNDTDERQVVRKPYVEAELAAKLRAEIRRRRSPSGVEPVTAV